MSLKRARRFHREILILDSVQNKVGAFITSVTLACCDVVPSTEWEAGGRVVTIRVKISLELW